MSFKPIISTDGGKTFGENALAFETKDEAERWAKALMGRWLAASHWSTKESGQPVNYRYGEDGSLTPVEPAAPPQT